MDALRALLAVDRERSGVAAGAAAAAPAARAALSAPRLSSAPTRRLLASLGSPQRLLRLVHVVGSKGKGSTAALLASVLRAAGVATGEYSSPHVASAGERLRVQGAPASDRELEELVARHEGAVRAAAAAEAARGGALSVFEALTALGVARFAERGVQVAVLEAGLGGVTDATNVAPADGSGLDAVVMTAVHREHAAALGGGVQAAARAKAAVARPGAPFVLGPQPHAAAEAVARGEACSRGAALLSVREACDFGVGSRGEVYVHVRGAEGGVVPAGGGVRLDGLRLALRGGFQAENAATAACAALALRARGGELYGGVDAAALAAGLQAEGVADAVPARFQVVRAAGGLRVVVDGAHTSLSARALGEALRGEFRGARVALATAMADDKDAAAFAASLAEGLGEPLGAVVACEAEVGGGAARSMPAGALAAAWRGACAGAAARHVEVCEAGGAGAAVRRAAALVEAQGGGVVCAAGSFGMAAPALKYARARGAQEAT